MLGLDATHISSPFLLKLIKAFLREDLLVMLVSAVCRGNGRQCQQRCFVPPHVAIDQLLRNCSRLCATLLYLRDSALASNASPALLPPMSSPTVMSAGCGGAPRAPKRQVHTMSCLRKLHTPSCPCGLQEVVISGSVDDV